MVFETIDDYTISLKDASELTSTPKETASPFTSTAAFQLKTKAVSVHHCISAGTTFNGILGAVCKAFFSGFGSGLSLPDVLVFHIGVTCQEYEKNGMGNGNPLP